MLLEKLEREEQMKRVLNALEYMRQLRRGLKQTTYRSAFKHLGCADGFLHGMLGEYSGGRWLYVSNYVKYHAYSDVCNFLDYSISQAERLLS